MNTSDRLKMLLFMIILIQFFSIIKYSLLCFGIKIDIVYCAEPPKIAPFQFPEELEVGGSTQATCSLVSGDKPIQFTWHKDNLPIPSVLKVGILTHITNKSRNKSNLCQFLHVFSQVEQKNMDFFTILVIQDLNSMHSGEYSCRATNDFGTVSHSASLVVKGRVFNIKYHPLIHEPSCVFNENILFNADMEILKYYKCDIFCK